MAAFWMCELAPTEVTRSDAFNRNQFVCRQALTHNRASQFGRVPAGRRALQVLVVDDERDAADTLVRLVSHWGHAVLPAYDGVTALKVAAAQHPDIVLLDIAMPHMDGCQVARQLRLDFPSKECFIIGVTACSDEQCCRECSEAGIDLVLIKPVQAAVFETLLMLECERVNRSRPASRARTAVSTVADAAKVAALEAGHASRAT